MSRESPAVSGTKCRNCGFETVAGSDEWETTTHPQLGDLTRCPKCGSTDTTTLS